MSRAIALTTALYPRESRADFDALVNDLLAQYPPASQEDWELLEAMANVAWLKQRYTAVRDQLFRQRNSLPEDDGRRAPIEQSIENFNREVQGQREQLALLRRQWRQMARPAVARREASSHVLVPAA